MKRENKKVMPKRSNAIETNDDDDDDETIDDSWEPPDGGWGWMIVIAAGFSNFCIFPCLQSFGLIFREKFTELEINSSQTTTIINVNSAVTACIGLANGPVFRKFTYRQVSLTGAFICAISITILSTMNTFTGVLMFFSILYGAGTGISGSANALALNTYFKKKRRIATGLSWTCTGLGPIIMPQIITILMPIFGMEGTVLIYGGVAFNAIACALLLQPVSWHVRKRRDVEEKLKLKSKGEKDRMPLNGSQSKSLENVTINEKVTKDNRLSRRFGSQYLYYDHEEHGASGIDVFNPGTPMLSRANDGWYSKKSIATSNNSLSSNKTIKRENSQKGLSRYPSVTMNLSRQPSLKALSRGSSVRNLNRQNSEAESWRNVSDKSTKRKLSNLPSSINSPLIIVNESCEHPEENCDNSSCSNEECMKRKLTRIFATGVNSFSDSLSRETKAIIVKGEDDARRTIEENNEKRDEEKSRWCRRFLRAIVVFFDLDLLKDLVYVNLMLGITFANFTELNFSLLTPFIFSEYGFDKIQIATVMSILAGVDVATRITIPFVAGYIGWENRSFFLLGVCVMALGRIVLAHNHDYGVALVVAILIGVGKALRTIFMALVIPSHVPLERLPAASGLQLLSSGIVFLIVGPAVGWIRDTTGDYAVVLHCLNSFTYLTAISWLTERWMTKRRDTGLKTINDLKNIYTDKC